MNFSDDRDPVESLAAEFMECYRRGENPSIEEYARRYPELAEQIRALFPTIADLEGWKLDHSPGPPGPLVPGAGQLKYLGDFRLIREIGRGGMGIVYEAEQESLGRHVAVKVLLQGPLLTEKQRRRFEREAKTAARLHHTNIVPVFGVGEQDGLHYYVMQIIRGVGLDAVIESLKRTHAAPSESNAGTSKGSAQPELGSGLEANSNSSFTPSQAAQALREGTFPSVELGNGLDINSRMEPQNGSSTNTMRNGPAPAVEPPSPSFAIEDSSAKTIAHEPAEITFPNPNTVNPSGPFPRAYWKAVARLGRQVANALDYAHSQHVLHRDIKPANLLLDATGTVWVADFGVAKVLEQEGLSNTGDIVGTLQYMAPEQFQGHYDTRSDICSMGLTLYELLTLRSAFQDSNRGRLIHRIIQEEPPRPRQINPAIPRDLETIVLKAIARDPGRRYQTARDLADDLQRYLEDRPLRARRVGPLERLGRWCRRNPAVASLTALAFALLILVAVVATAGYVHTRDALEGETTERQRAEKALDGEAQQRLRAEATSSLALEVLEEIFEQLAPDRIVAASELTFESAGGEQVEVALQPTLSPETAALLKQMLAFYDRLAEQGHNDSKVRRQAAKATRRVGDIHLYLGDSEQAVEAYHRATDLYKDLAGQAPDDLSLTAELAAVCNALGQALRKSNQPAQARVAHLTAVEVLTAPTLPSPASAKINYELARTYYHLGKIPLGPPGSKKPGGPPPGKQPGPKDPGSPPPGKQPRPKDPGFPPTWLAAQAEAGQYLNQAIALLKDLVQEPSAVPAYQHLLALCLREKSARSSVPFFNIAGEDRKEAVALLEELVQKYPSVPDYRYDLCVTLAQQDRGGPPFSPFPIPKNLAKDYDAALLLAKDLVAEHPNVPDYQITKSQINMKLGQFHQQNKKLNQAEQHWRQALQIHTTLVQRYPRVIFHHLFKAKVQESLAGLLLEQNKLEESRSLLESSIDQLKKLLAQEEEKRFLTFALADNYTGLAKTLHAMQKRELAAEAEQQAQKLRQSLFKGPPGFPKKSG